MNNFKSCQFLTKLGINKLKFYLSLSFKIVKYIYKKNQRFF